jgi:hypothetical protein
MYNVYIKIDSNNVITQVISDIESVMMGVSLDGLIMIDSGEGDKFVHASSNYLEKKLIDSNGKFNYKLVDGKAIERTDDEKETLFPAVTPAPSSEEQIQTNRADIDYILIMQGL